MIPDNYDLFEMHEREKERKIKRLPVCASCGEPIMSDKAYCISGWFCESCFEDWANNNSVWVENLIDEG